MTNNGTGGLADATRIIGRVGPIIGIAVVLCVLAVAVLSKAGCANHHTPPGFEGYVRSKPLLGAGEFVGIQRGPTSTGWVWRQDVVNIDMRPRTYSEDMDIRTAKGSNLQFKAHARIQLEPKGSKEIVEKFGGANWYELNVQKSFQRAVRERVQRLEPFEVKKKTDKIAAEVLASMKKDYDGTPIQFESVDIGNIRYPDAITDSVLKKFVTAQENERKNIELEIAKKQIEIATVEAMGKADAQRVISKTLDPLLLQYEALRAVEQLANARNTTFLLMPMDQSGSAPVILDLGSLGQDDDKDDAAKAKDGKAQKKTAARRTSASTKKADGESEEASK